MHCPFVGDVYQQYIIMLIHKFFRVFENLPQGNTSSSIETMVLDRIAVTLILYKYSFLSYKSHHVWVYSVNATQLLCKMWFMYYTTILLPAKTYKPLNVSQKSFSMLYSLLQLIDSDSLKCVVYIFVLRSKVVKVEANMEMIVRMSGQWEEVTGIYTGISIYLQVA